MDYILGIFRGDNPLIAKKKPSCISIEIVADVTHFVHFVAKIFSSLFNIRPPGEVSQNEFKVYHNCQLFRI
jgi:hypothetical protein